MPKRSKPPSREQADFRNAQVYHAQLLTEILSLFSIYCGMCGEHGREVEPALARAIFFTLFGCIEASSRVLATSLLLADIFPRKKGSRTALALSLSEAETLFLRQETAEISRTNWTVCNRTKFVALEDALVGYPAIYARVFRQKVSISKSCREWQDFMKLKRLRDIGAHGNTNELRSAPDSMHVSYADLKRLIECRRWYCSQLVGLPWIANVEAREEIRFIDLLLEAGFSDKCRKIREKRYTQQHAAPL